MSTKIEYLRTKTQGKDRIIYDDKSQSFKNRHITIVKGYDHILNRWCIISTKTELLAVETYPTHPEKVKSFFAVIKRKATDYASLKLLTRYYKQKITVSIKDVNSNIYLVIANGTLFQTDALRHDFSMTAPISMNALMVPRYRKDLHLVDVKFEPEATPITNAEKEALLNEGYPLYEETFTKQDGSESEYKTITSDIET